MNPVSRSVRNSPLIITRLNYVHATRSQPSCKRTAQTRTVTSTTSASQSKNSSTPSESTSNSTSKESSANTQETINSTQPPPPPPTENISTTSQKVWKTIYLATGAAVVGAGVVAANNPDVTSKRLSAMKEDIDQRIRFYAEPSREKLLPDAQSPYAGALPPRTLVIELDKTLVHSSYNRATGWRVAKRPGAEAFLAYMASFYEVVVFTSNLNSYADPILDRLDPNVYVSHRLYRAETHYKNGVHIKDISHLNRPLERVVVIDINEKNVSMQPENAIIIPEWTGDPSDTALLDLIPVLENLVRSDVRDVREEIGVLKGQSITEGVAEYRALAAKKASKHKSASLFGNDVVSNASIEQVQPSEGDDDGSDKRAEAKGVWGTLSSTSKLFHSKQ